MRFRAIFTLAIILFALPSLALSQTHTWIAPGNGNWSDGVNWLGGTAPSSGGSATTTLIMGNKTGPFTATNDLGGAFTLNQLTLNHEGYFVYNNFFGLTPFTIASAGGNSLTFDGSNPTIELAGPSESRISSAILLNASTTFAGSGLGSADLTGEISGTGGLIIDTMPQTANTGWVQLRAANSFSGGVTQNSGSLYLGNNAAAGTGTITINGGDLRSGNVTLNNAIVVNGGLDFRGSGSTTFSTMTSSATGSLSGNGGIALSGNGGIAIQNAATISGDVSTSFLNIGDQFIGTLNPPFTQGPQLTFSGADGTGLNLNSFNMANQGRLYLDNQGAVNGDRIADTAAVNLKDGDFWFRGNTGVLATESFGNLTVEGQSLVTLFSSSSTSSGAAQLTGNSLARVNGGTIIFRGTKLGSSPDASAGTTNMFFNNAPTADLIGGGGAAGTTTISILPYATGDTAPLGTGTGLVTYDATTGIRLLDVATEYNSSINTATSLENVYLAGSTALTGDRTINALNIVPGPGGATLSGSGTLTLGSGVLQAASAGTTNIDVPLNFGTQEGIVFSNGANSTVLRINGNMTGSGGLTTGGISPVELTGDNSGLTGTFRVNGGMIGISSDANLPGTGAVQIIGGVTNIPVYAGGIYKTGSGDSLITRDIDVSGGAVIFGNTPQSGAITFSGTISGDGGVRILTGSNGGDLSLTGNNTYTGPTAIHGKLRINGDAALGNGGSVDLGAGSATTLALDGNWDTNRLITRSGGIILDTNGFDANFNGKMTGTGQINKAGAGTMSITSQTSTVGGVNVLANGGTYLLTDSGSTLDFSVSAASGGKIQLDNTALAVENRIQDGVQVSLSGGELSLIGNASTAINETLGSLTIQSGSSGSTVTVADNGAGTILTFGGAFVSNNASVLFRGDNLGSSGASQVFLSGYSDNTILINALADSSAMGDGTGASAGQAFYDIADGVRVMQDTDFTDVGPGETFTLIQNSAPVNLPTSALVRTIGAAQTGAAGEDNTIAALRLSSDSTVSIATGTTLNISSGAVLFDAGTATSQTISGGTLASGSSSLAVVQNNAATTATISSDISTSGGLNKTGAGQLDLTGAVNLSGGLTVSGGTLDVSNVAGGLTLATNAPGISVVNNGVLVTGTGGVAANNVMFASAGSIDGAVNFNNDAGQTIVATFDGVGTTTNNTDFNLTNVGGASVTSVFTHNNSNGDTLTLAGKISGTHSNWTGTTILDFRGSGSDGTGVIKLTNDANDFVVNRVQIGSQATLAIDNDSQLGASSNDVKLNGGVLRFDASMSIARNVVNGGGSVTGFNTNGNTVTMTGLISGAGTFNKIGAGTLVFAGTSNTGVTNALLNLNEGNFNIAAGSTWYAGSSSAASTGNAVNINSGATVSGSGALRTSNEMNPVTRIVLHEGGTVAPGDGIGTLSMSELLWEQGGMMEWELASGGVSDLLDLANGFDSSGSGPFAWSFIDLGFDDASVYTLATFSSTTFNGGVAGIVSSTEMTYTGLLDDRGQFTIVDIGSGRLELRFNAVPEPGSIGLLGLLALGLASRIRRRRSV